MIPDRQTVRVDIPGSSYDVVIGPGLLSEAGVRLRTITPARRVATISDDEVWARYGASLAASLAGSAFEVLAIRVPAGESSKSWERAGSVLEELAEAGLDREDVIVALGGGVVGDLAGFCAATYLRGVEFAQLPTTLLAQVDSSVGGKTGVDLKAGKNLAGAFKQPSLVLADTETLATLPDVEWASGLVEVAKVAVLEAEERLVWTEAHADDLRLRTTASVCEAVRTAVSFKAHVVAADERESGLRECLNYGHTLGHAIERVSGYGSIPHGIAVAEGIRFAAELAVDARGAAPELAARQAELLDMLGVPRARFGADPAALRSSMASDKKARGGRPRFVLVTAPGVFSVGSVDDDLLDQHLQRYAADVNRRG